MVSAPPGADRRQGGPLPAAGTHGRLFGLSLFHYSITLYITPQKKGNVFGKCPRRLSFLANASFSWYIIHDIPHRGRFSAEDPFS
jgi:hypothetical protein